MTFHSSGCGSVIPKSVCQFYSCESSSTDLQLVQMNLVAHNWRRGEGRFLQPAIIFSKFLSCLKKLPMGYILNNWWTSEAMGLTFQNYFFFAPIKVLIIVRIAIQMLSQSLKLHRMLSVTVVWPLICFNVYL